MHYLMIWQFSFMAYQHYETSSNMLRQSIDRFLCRDFSEQILSVKPLVKS